MNMKRSFIRVFLSLFMCAVIAQFPVMISNAETTPKMPYLRIDRGDKDAWQGELDNVRFVTKDAYKLGKAKEKYGIDPNFVPSTKGLDYINVSASTQFSTPQFRNLAAQIREYAGDKDVYSGEQ